MSDGLKPCPFCGGKPYLQSRHDYWRIRCEDCPVDISMDTSGDCVEAWNRRSPCPDVSRLLAAAKEALREHERRGWAREECMSRLSAAVAELEAGEGQGGDGPGEA